MQSNVCYAASSTGNTRRAFVKACLYWTSATLLLIALLIGLFLTGGFIADQHWPFHLFGGGFIAILGFVLVFLGRKVPLALFGIRRAPSEPDPKIVSQTARLAVSFGLLIALGGIGFALTHQVDVLVFAFVMAVFLSFQLGTMKIFTKIQLVLTGLVIVVFIVGMRMALWLHSMDYTDPMRREWEPRLDTIGTVAWFGTLIPWVLFSIIHAIVALRRQARGEK